MGLTYLRRFIDVATPFLNNHLFIDKENKEICCDMSFAAKKLESVSILKVRLSRSKAAVLEQWRYVILHSISAIQSMVK